MSIMSSPRNQSGDIDLFTSDETIRSRSSLYSSAPSGGLWVLQVVRLLLPRPVIPCTEDWEVYTETVSLETIIWIRLTGMDR